MTEQNININWYKSITMFLAPRKYWSSLKAAKPSFNDMLSSYMLPWLGITAMVVFAMLWINAPGNEYLGALRKAVVVFAYLFFNIYATAWSLSRLAPVFNFDIHFPTLFLLVASLTPVLCIDTVISVFNAGQIFVKPIMLLLFVLAYMGFIYLFNFSRKIAVICSLFIFVLLTAVSIVVTVLLQSF